MKLFLYDGLDGNGKATYQSIEIDEKEAAAWVQVDFERQQKEKVIRQRRGQFSRS